MRDGHIWASVAVMAGLTAVLRFLPFVVWSGDRRVPQVIQKMSKALPCAVMGMLVVYCLKDVSFESAAGFVPEIIACAVVVGTYGIKRNTLMSIICGTVCYMILVQTIF